MFLLLVVVVKGRHEEHAGSLLFLVWRNHPTWITAGFNEENPAEYGDEGSFDGDRGRGDDAAAGPGPVSPMKTWAGRRCTTKGDACTGEGGDEHHDSSEPGMPPMLR